MRLCLVEDQAVSDLEPLTLTRPVFDLRLGAQTLGTKLARAFRSAPGPTRRGALIRPHLAPLCRLRDPGLAVNDRTWLARAPVLVANARWVPPAELLPPDPDPPWVGTCDGRPACAAVGPDRAAALEWGGIDAWFDAVAARARGVDLGGEWIAHPRDLVAKNADHLARDAAPAGAAGRRRRHRPHAAVVGPADRLALHDTARIDPYTVFDTTGGPITIAAGVVVLPFTRVEGPCSIGRDTQLFGAHPRGGVTLGPGCRIGGEVEASIVHGSTNKYHDGFLGHAYVGQWVNLGAITSNSDLRNDYGEVAVPLGGDPIPTGRAKVGSHRAGQGRLLPGRPYPHRPGQPAQHRHGRRRDVHPAAGRAAAAQVRAVVRRGAPRPGGAGAAARAAARHGGDRPGPPRPGLLGRRGAALPRPLRADPAGARADLSEARRPPGRARGTFGRPALERVMNCARSHCDHKTYAAVAGYGSISASRYPGWISADFSGEFITRSRVWSPTTPTPMTSPIRKGRL